MFLVAVAFGASGCALVSGLSNLDVGLDASLDAAVADASTDAPSDGGGLDGGPALDAAKDADASGLTDAGMDADAAACAVTGTSPSTFATTCPGGNPIFQAGTIPSATYSLTQLREFPQTCNGYVASTATGLLEVVVQGSTYFLRERLTINGVTTNRHYTATVSGTTMTATVTCGPSVPSNQWSLFVSVSGASTLLVVYKPSPPTDQRFFWTQQ